MGCLCCSGGRKSARVAPDERSSSTAPVSSQHSQAKTLSHADTLNNSSIDSLLRERGNGHKLHGSVVRECASFIDDILSSLLVAAKLAVPSTGSTDQQEANITETAQVPSDVAALQRQLSKAVGATRPSRTGALSQLADYLLAVCKQQQSQWPSAGAAADCWVPSADVLVNNLNILLFAQVTLDTAAVLHSRYKQCSNALGVIGLQVSTLSAIVRAASKAILVYLILGKAAEAGELKVPLIVRRNTAFWDALQQLQQQGIVPACIDQQQQRVKLQLAKLFPRFVDESLGLQQQQQQRMQQDLSGQGNARQWLGSGSNGDSTDLVLVTVEGGEGHGPRKELFGLVGENWTKSVQDQQPALFVHIRAAGTWWYNTVLQQTPQLGAAYWATGWLLGQAIINRSLVGVQLAPLLFHMLLQPDNGFKATLAVLEQHDLDAAQSLSAVLKMPQQQYQELLHVEEQPSSVSRQAYVDQAVQRLLVHDVVWQHQALRQGFYTVVDRQVLLDCCFDGHSLAAAICGPSADTTNTDFDIKQVFRVVLEDEEASSSLGQTAAAAAGNEPVQPSNRIVGQEAASEISTVALTVKCLWQVLDGWSPQQKRAFVKFVTGSDRLPPVGSERLTLSFPFVVYGIKQHQQLLGTLPQSHTCANTLELPNYAEAIILNDHQLAQEWRDAVDDMTKHGSSGSSTAQLLLTCPNLVDRCRTVVEERLLIAVTSCQSYGLDEASTSTGVHAGQGAPMAAAEQRLPLLPRPIVATGHWQGNTSMLNNLSSSKNDGDSCCKNDSQGVVGSMATSSSSIGVVKNGVPDILQSDDSSRAGAYTGSTSTIGRQDLGDILYITPDDKLDTSIGQQDPFALLLQQQQRQPQSRLQSHEAVVATKQQPVGNPKLLTESDEEFLDGILEGGMRL